MKLCIAPNSDFLNDSPLLIQSTYLKLNIISWGKEKHARLKEYFYNKRLQGECAVDTDGKWAIYLFQEHRILIH